MPEAHLGWIVAAGRLGYLAGLAALVPLGDMTDRRKLIAGHLALTAAGAVLAATASRTWVLLAGLAVAGLFAVVVQTTVAFAAALSAPAERGRNLGAVTSGVVAGILGARVAAGALASASAWGWRSVYVALAVLLVTLAGLVLRALPPDPRAKIGLFGLAGALGAGRAGRWADAGFARSVTGVALVLLAASWLAIAQASWSLWLVVVGVVVLDFAVQAVHVSNQHLLTGSSILGAAFAACALGSGHPTAACSPAVTTRVRTPWAASAGYRCDHGVMTAWQDVEQAEPEFAKRVRALFDAHRHKTIATLRADGSPRISGIEAAFEDGELVFASMPSARKSADLLRDPRFALHSATVDPVEGAEAQWPGEAKVSGRALAAGTVVEGPEGDRFRADIAEVVLTHLNEKATLLVVEWWTPAHGLRRVERE